VPLIIGANDADIGFAPGCRNRAGYRFPTERAVQDMGM
jgi:hypothetical protein